MIGAEPKNAIRNAVAVTQAKVTGIRERGLNSKRSSSTASRIADTGLPKVAAIPAAAPADRRIFLSSAVVLRNWPTTEPKAPPVAMIGPSAPKGPPVPMAMAAEIGLRKVRRGGILL